MRACTCWCTRCSGRAVQDGEGGVLSSLSRLRRHSKLNVGLLEAKKRNQTRFYSNRPAGKHQRKKKKDNSFQRFNAAPPCGEGRNHLLGERLPSGQMSCWSSSQSASGCCCSSLEACRSKRPSASSCSRFASLSHQRNTETLRSETVQFQLGQVITRQRRWKNVWLGSG